VPRRLGKSRHFKNPAPAIQSGGNELRLASEIECDVDYGLNIGRAEVKIPAGLLKLIGMAPRDFADILLKTQQALNRLIVAFRSGRIEAATFAEHIHHGKIEPKLL
jgi:hypothetical protein